MILVEDQLPFDRGHVVGRVFIVHGHQRLRDLVKVNIAGLHAGQQHSGVADVDRERLVALAQQRSGVKYPGLALVIDFIAVLVGLFVVLDEARKLHHVIGIGQREWKTRMRLPFVIADAPINAEDGEVGEVRVTPNVDVDLLEEGVVQIYGPGEITPFERLSVFAGQRIDTGQASTRSEVRLDDHAFGKRAVEIDDFAFTDVTREVLDAVRDFLGIAGNLGNVAQDHPLDRVLQRLEPPIPDGVNDLLVRYRAGIDVYVSALAGDKLLLDVLPIRMIAVPAVINVHLLVEAHELLCVEPHVHRDGRQPYRGIKVIDHLE